MVNVPESVPSGTVTGTEIVQLPIVVGLPAGMVPSVKVTLLVVVETVPPQLVIAVPATINGLGKLSVTLTPVYAESVGFWSVMIRVVTSRGEKVVGENCFVRPIS